MYTTMLKRKLLCLAFITLASGLSSFAAEEPKAPVFVVSYSSASPKAGDVIEVILTAEIPQGLHMYSTYNKCDIGPLKLDIRFNQNKSFQLVGAPYSIGDKKSVDEIFECELGMFDKQAEVRQKIKILAGDIVIGGTIEGQWCTESTCYNFGSLVPLSFSSTLKVAGKAAKSSGKPATKKPGTKNIKPDHLHTSFLRPADYCDVSTF